MTVETYAHKHRLSPETVRRYIRLGKLKAHRIGRRYEIDTHDTYDNKHDTIHDNIQHLIAEKDEPIKQLSQQNERLTQLLAMQSKQNQQLIAQLPPPRPTSPPACEGNQRGGIERITKLFAKLSTKQA